MQRQGDYDPVIFYNGRKRAERLFRLIREIPLFF